MPEIYCVRTVSRGLNESSLLEGILLISVLRNWVFMQILYEESGVFFCFCFFTSAALCRYMAVYHVVCLNCFVSYGADWLCCEPPRVFIYDAMETRRTGGDTQSRISWQLNRHILTSLTSHKRLTLSVGACTCAHVHECVCLELRESENAQRGKKVPEWKPNYLSKGLSAWSESGLQRVSHQSTPLKLPLNPSHNGTPTCLLSQRQTDMSLHCPLSLPNLFVSAHEAAACAVAGTSTNTIYGYLS